MPTDAPVSFAAFVVSLGTTAAIHLGDLADPQTGRPGTPDLEAATQMIDVLAMLEEKTRGNLSPQERTLVEGLLYELRMRFLQVQQGEKKIIVP